MLACLRPSIHPSCSPSVPSSFSSMPDKNVSFCTRGPILCLKSHLHRSHSFCRFSPSSVVSVCLTRLICRPCSSLPPAAATGATDTFIVLLFLNPTRSHLPPARGGRALGCQPAGAFIHSSPCPSEPLIPSSLHPVTEEWPVRRAGGQSGRCEGCAF